MPAFHVVRLDQNGEELYSSAGRGQPPNIYENGQDASSAASSLIRITGVKHQPRPIKEDIDWQARERERFESKYYTKLPWHNEPWVSSVKACAEHFAHVSRQDATRLAYTADPVKGSRDIKTPVRPSKYLANFYGGVLDESMIRDLVATYKKLYDKGNVLNFAYSGKEIERVYRRGPNSCMSVSLNQLASKIHPTRAYEGPDLAVAYIERNTKVIARALVWPKKKRHSRIYGDDYLLSQLLEDEGYREGSFQGARLTKITHETGRYVCPYIDNTRQVKVGKKYLTIHRDGRTYAGNTDGLAGQCFRCGLCNQNLDVHKVAHRNLEGSYACTPCFDAALRDDRIFECSRSHAFYHVRHRVIMYNGEAWHEGCATHRDYAFLCSVCNQRFPLRDGRNLPFYMGRRIHTDPWICRPCGTPQRELPI